MRPAPPDLATLVLRARGLVGRSLGEISAGFGETPPANLRRQKGWIGQLMERELGAPATQAAGPDFPRLGVELKTIPVGAAGRPVASTWVCVADADQHAPSWRESLAWSKLACVLWVAVDGGAGVAPAHRRVRWAGLWRPSVEQEAVLREDWEQHVETLALGETWRISARVGVALQLRPKAARGSVTRWTVGEEGEWVRAQPKGFYLRRAFTEEVLSTLAGGRPPAQEMG